MINTPPRISPFDNVAFAEDDSVAHCPRPVLAQRIPVRESQW